MKPEHEAFLIGHVKKLGFVFIIDCLKDKFPSLSHYEACAIFGEFESKYSEDGNVKQAAAQLKEIGKEMSKNLENILAQN